MSVLAKLALNERLLEESGEIIRARGGILVRKNCSKCAVIFYTKESKGFILCKSCCKKK